MHVEQQVVLRAGGVSRMCKRGLVGQGVLAISLLAGSAAAAPNSEATATFATEVDAAMHRMMDAMAVKSSGDADRDFVAMMVPHHQGAIDMAVAELRFGKNERLRRIAREIIVEQQQEIAAMRLALAPPSDMPPSPPAAVRAHPSHGQR